MINFCFAPNYANFFPFLVIFFKIYDCRRQFLPDFYKKNVPWHILAPRAVACDSLHLRASAHLWHVSAFLCNREFLGISCYIKKRRSFLTFPETAPQLFDHFCPCTSMIVLFFFSITDTSLNPQPCQASPTEDRYLFFRSGRMLRSACRSDGGDQAS